MYKNFKGLKVGFITKAVFHKNLEKRFFRF